MALPRYVPTKLLEACNREARACFEQASLVATLPIIGEVTLETLYKANDVWNIHPFPLMAGATIQLPRQVNIQIMPAEFEPGLGGTNKTGYMVEFDFFFPVDV